MVWLWSVTLDLAQSAGACKACSKRNLTPTDMVIVCARPRGGSDDASVFRYCPDCYEGMVTRAQAEGELRSFPQKIKPNQRLLATVPAYIVVNSDVLIFWKKEKETKT
jgi:hypothetical protein